MSSRSRVGISTQQSSLVPIGVGTVRAAGSLGKPSGCLVSAGVMCDGIKGMQVAAILALF